MPLQASNYTNMFNTGGTTSTPSSNTGDGSIWSSLFGNLGSILIGTGGLVTAIKADPNEIAKYQSQQQIYIPGIGTQTVSNNSIYLVIAIVVILVIVMVVVFANKKK